MLYRPEPPPLARRNIVGPKRPICIHCGKPNKRERATMCSRACENAAWKQQNWEHVLELNRQRRAEARARREIERDLSGPSGRDPAIFSELDRLIRECGE